MLFNVSDVMKLFIARFKIKLRHLQLSCVRAQPISHPRLPSSLNLFESRIKSLGRMPQVPEQTASPRLASLKGHPKRSRKRISQCVVVNSPEKNGISFGKICCFRMSLLSYAFIDASSSQRLIE